MKSYMIEIRLPEAFTDEFITLIPHQRMHINNLMHEGKIKCYSLSADRTKLWVILDADNHFKAEVLIKSFPIFPYIRYQINELLFHEMASITAPQLWLN